MGHYSKQEIMHGDYKRIALDAMLAFGAIEECIYCHAQYLTGKDEDSIEKIVTAAFIAKFGANNFNNRLMKDVVKEILDETCYGHACEDRD